MFGGVPYNKESLTIARKMLTRVPRMMASLRQ